MQIIKEQKIGDYYVSAVDISKDEWLEILKDKTVSEKYKEAVICFYYMPDYKGSCVASWQSIREKCLFIGHHDYEFRKVCAKASWPFSSNR